jgi:predicted nucleic acid-binding protein
MSAVREGHKTANLIHFDTNALVALPLWARQGHPVVERIAEGASAAACALVWYEFLCGPVSAEHIELAHAILSGRVESIGETQAQRAARLFNATGRARRLRTDALIAASAIEAGAALATLNRQDFAAFEPLGLVLA